MAKLIFKRPPATSARLIFNESEGSASSDATIGLVGSLGDFGGSVLLGIGQSILLVGSMGAFGGEVAVEYSSQTQRPLASAIVARFQDAEQRVGGLEGRMQDGQRLRVESAVRWQDAQAVRADASIAWQDTQRLRRSADVAFQDGVSVTTGVAGGFSQARRARHAVDGRFEDGVPVRAGFAGAFQNTVRHRSDAAARFQQGVRVSAALVHPMRDGRPVRSGPDPSLFQDARRPPPGVWTKPPVQPEDPCYIPGSARLVFAQPWSDSGRLIFICERHPPGPQPGETVVVPIQRIYTVINYAVLRRVDGGVLIPTYSMALTIDVDSWTWGFTARVPGTALPDLEPDIGGPPVELEATVNGVPYRAIVESIARERTFGRADLNIAGRGRSALLDAPYTAVQTFGNAGGARTAQQLALDVLTFNGASIGWDINWTPEDWLVPAGVFSHQGSYITALNAIAGAAGAYIQPHRTGKSLDFLLRYPAKPWEWDDVTPDYELPADVVQKEGIVWSDKAAYNRVFVRGVKVPYLGQVTRAGTAGDIDAPMVTDPLITTTVAGRQRGLPALADVGRQAAVSLRLPVLAETGIIPPGKFVRYVDGGVTRIGLVRSTSAAIERADEKLTIWQTIGVETHVGL